MTDKWISLKEATMHTGLSASTIKRAARDGRLKRGRATTGRGKQVRLAVRFKVSELDRWLQQAA